MPGRSAAPRTRDESMPAAVSALPGLVALAVLAVPWPALAQAVVDDTSQVVISATRVALPAFDVPASVDRIDGHAAREGQAQINISESLAGVPGLLARDRQNFAQDVQISVRGFGARASFGIRGVRLYVDGVPATMPDGQGQLSNVDLASVSHIEVLRGPFSALYGNSSGGVILVTTEDGAGAPRLDWDALLGSDGLWRLGAQASGAHGALAYRVSASRFRTDGFRDHSRTERSLGNAKFTFRPNEGSTLTLTANSVALPLAQDPLGLTRADFEADPRGVDPAALTFDTRKSMHQSQVGLVFGQRLSASHDLSLTAYRGHRDTEQTLSIPVGVQRNPLQSGGVVSLERDYQGLDLRWTARGEHGGGPYTVVAGLAYDGMLERRQGFENFVGSTLGVRGRLRRDEDNRISNLDPYLQGHWQLHPRWALHAGVRRSAIRFRSADHYVGAGNPDDSGAVEYAATLPMLGLRFAAGDDTNLYATAGRGFETPTMNELSYRPDGSSGLNFQLDAARSTNLELGLKTRVRGLWSLSAAVFRTRTEREIVTLTNSGGRATFQNAGTTERSGAELSLGRHFAGDLHAQLALATLNARYRDGFLTCAGSPCLAPTLQIPAGNRLPGVARGTVSAALNWTPASGWRGGAQLRALTRVFVDDRNSQTAPGHAVVSVWAGHRWQYRPWTLTASVRIDNLLDRQHVGSVIVNDGNQRFFESAPGRTGMAKLSVSREF